MIDTIKKTLLAGVGAAVITTEKAEAAFADLVKQGKMSSAEARATAEKIAADGKKEFEALSAELGDKLRDAFAGLSGGTQERIAALEARIKELESERAAKSKHAPKS
jgi:polyhydroxyalkanoate synthesis regulator phasin